MATTLMTTRNILIFAYVLSVHVTLYVLMYRHIFPSCSPSSALLISPQTPTDPYPGPFHRRLPEEGCGKLEYDPVTWTLRWPQGTQVDGEEVENCLQEYNQQATSNGVLLTNNLVGDWIVTWTDNRESTYTIVREGRTLKIRTVTCSWTTCGTQREAEVLPSTSNTYAATDDWMHVKDLHVGGGAVTYLKERNGALNLIRVYKSPSQKTMMGEGIKAQLIKHIIYPNNTVHNLGCSKHTAMCKEHAHWDHGRNVRVSTPPCCVFAMKEVLRIVSADLHANNISHTVFGGTLLGYARNKQFVPYDNDLDVWMDGKFWNSQVFKELVKKWTSVDGMYTAYKDSGGKLWVLYSKENGNGIDIWPWYVRGDKLRIKKSGDHKQYDIPTRFMLPLKSVNFAGIPTFVPGDVEGYCKYRYGAAWKTEMKCSQVERRKCLA